MANSNNAYITQSSETKADDKKSTVFIKKNHKKQARLRNTSNFVIVWLDAYIDLKVKDYQNSITKLRGIVNTINTFNDGKACESFIDKITNEKVFIIISGGMGQTFVPKFEQVSYVDSIYIFCYDKIRHESWARSYSKVKGIFTNIDDLCKLLKADVKSCDNDMIAISILSAATWSESATDRLDQSFMYSQLLKENLLDIPYSDGAKKELVEFCRAQYSENTAELKIIDEFDRCYQLHSPIWWYTRESFTYSMVNRALRTLDVEMIMKLGFFISDLHNQICNLYKNAGDRYDGLVVYRGQGMARKEFEKVKKSKNCLLSFNNFLSTSTNQAVALQFAQNSMQNPYLIGVLFEIKIDVAVETTPFAKLDAISYYEAQEKEVLFSMHTVFRISDIKSMNDRLWRVTINLTSDIDQDLERLTERIRQDTSGSTGWHRLGRLMITMGAYDQAEDVYHQLIDAVSDSECQEATDLYHQLGFIEKEKGNLEQALVHFEEVLRIQQKLSLTNFSSITTTYINIGEVYREKENYSTALTYYQKALELQKKQLSSNDSAFSVTYNCIGLAHQGMGNYESALEFFKQALQIQREKLPSNHPSLATTYNCMGVVYDALGDYNNALAFYQKTLDIQQNSLPPYHPSLASTFSNIGTVHDSMGRSSWALSYYQKALEIELKSLPPDHPSLATTYNNMATAYEGLEQYDLAVHHAQRAVDISRTALGSASFQFQRYESYLDRLRKHLN